MENREALKVPPMQVGPALSHSNLWDECWRYVMQHVLEVVRQLQQVQQQDMAGGDCRRGETPLEGLLAARCAVTPRRCARRRPVLPHPQTAQTSPLDPPSAHQPPPEA